MADSNIFLGYQLGRSLAFDVSPNGLDDPAAIARFVNDIDKPLFVDGDGRWDWVKAGQHLQRMADAGRREFRGSPDPEPLGIALRLWAGCIWAAKVIDRPHISPADRRRHFSEHIDPHARADRVFRAGVEAAPALNALRGSLAPNLDGVPRDSPVRRHIA